MFRFSRKCAQEISVKFGEKKRSFFDSKEFNCLPRLFADDICFLINSPNLASLETEMNKDLANIYKWCIANKLSINPLKSNLLSITPQTKYTKSPFYLIH